MIGTKNKIKIKNLQILFLCIAKLIMINFLKLLKTLYIILYLCIECNCLVKVKVLNQLECIQPSTI